MQLPPQRWPLPPGYPGVADAPHGTGKCDPELMGAFLEQELVDRQGGPKHLS